jgi:lipid II:glycine glycyltransferase (peptidoglycan interpeptide bridge formation enzyme)
MRVVNEPFRILDNLDTKFWDDFNTAHPYGHLLQSSAWGELKARFAWSVQRVALERDGKMIAGAQILFRRLPMGWWYAYVPRGPVVDPQDSIAFEKLRDAMIQSAKKRGAFALKIEPNFFHSNSFSFSNWQKINPTQPRTTIHVDLTRDLEKILADMKSKWRYNIRLAERKGVTVRVGTANDVSTFYQLLQVTGKRDGFAIHSADYYRVAYELLSAYDRARLFIAEFQGQALAMILVTAVGHEAIYLYGASSDEHRELMPNHALHWAAIHWAKSCGCTRYDLWGIADTAWAEVNQETDEEKLPHGLYRFKQGFGGQVVRYVGAYEMVLSEWQNKLFQTAMAARRGASL